MGRVTISSVAELAGVDLSTVSRVLNQSFDNHKYAAATIERINRAAEELGYQPSYAARSLRTGKTMLLGVVVADIGNPFFSEIASQLGNCLDKYGYRMVISSTNESPKRQQEHIDSMLAYRVDGMIVAPCGPEGLNKALKAGVPVVTIDRPFPSSNLSFVGIDNYAAGNLLAEKLAACGYSKVAVVIPEGKTDITLQDRLQGLDFGLKKEAVDVSWILQVPSTTDMRDEVRSAVALKLQDIDSMPDAIVGMTNVCTLGILQALEGLDLNWSDNLGLAGIDDFAAAALVHPAISVVSQPLSRIALEASSLLLRLMENTDGKKQRESVLVGPEWIERESLPPMKG